MKNLRDCEWDICAPQGELAWSKGCSPPRPSFLSFDSVTVNRVGPGAVSTFSHQEMDSGNASPDSGAKGRPMRGQTKAQIEYRRQTGTLFDRLDALLTRQRWKEEEKPKRKARTAENIRSRNLILRECVEIIERIRRDDKALEMIKAKEAGRQTGSVDTGIAPSGGTRTAAFSSFASLPAARRHATSSSMDGHASSSMAPQRASHPSSSLRASSCEAPTSSNRRALPSSAPLHAASLSASADFPSWARDTAVPGLAPPASFSDSAPVTTTASHFHVDAASAHSGRASDASQVFPWQHHHHPQDLLLGPQACSNSNLKPDPGHPHNLNALYGPAEASLDATGGGVRPGPGQGYWHHPGHPAGHGHGGQPPSQPPHSRDPQAWPGHDWPRAALGHPGPWFQVGAQEAAAAPASFGASHGHGALLEAKAEPGAEEHCQWAHGPGGGATSNLKAGPERGCSHWQAPGPRQPEPQQQQLDDSLELEAHGERTWSGAPRATMEALWRVASFQDDPAHGQPLAPGREDEDEDLFGLRLPSYSESGPGSSSGPGALAAHHASDQALGHGVLQGPAHWQQQQHRGPHAQLE